MKIANITPKIPSLFVALISLVSIGCTNPLKDSDNKDASAKSLDNFARSDGSVKRNVCKGNELVTLGIKSEWDHVDFSKAPPHLVPDLKNTLKATLSAVPANLQQLYFGLGGTIVFKDKLGERSTNKDELTCETSHNKDRFQKEGSNKIEACWTVDPKSKDLVILMNPSAESIQHSTVRIFGYILSQVLTKLSANDAGVLVREKDEAFDRLISDIASAVVADVKKPGSKYNFKVNESLLQSADFKYFAFAESFDSFYCNTELRDSMARADEFPKTYALFVEMDTELKKVKLTNDTKTEGTFSLSETSQFDAAIAGNSGQGFQLGILGGLFRGLGGVGRLVGGGLMRGVGAIGRGAAMLGKGALIGGGRLLGGAARGVGALLGGGGGGGLIDLASSIMGMFGGGGGGGGMGGGGGGGGGAAVLPPVDSPEVVGEGDAS